MTLFPNMESITYPLIQEKDENKSMSPLAVLYDIQFTKYIFRTTFIRGQNVYLDQLEIIEREKRRQIALAHQEAIRKQLEEREQRRKEERERRIQEEREEELRIEREQEIERKRREHEQKLLEEKQERERRRKEAIQEALEIAEKEAKLEKMKQKMSKQNVSSNINLTESIIEKDKVPETLEECNKKLANSKEENINSELNNNRILNPNNDNNIINNNKISNLDQHNNNLVTTHPSKMGENSKTDNDNNKKTSSCQIIVSPRESNKARIEDDNNNAQKMLSPRDKTETRSTSPQPSIRSESVALLLQQNLDSLQNVQYAVLVPTINPLTHAALPIAVPITMTNDRILNSARTENRVLTPTQWRNEKKILCDSSTQTDLTEFSRSGTADFTRDRYREKNNSEISYDNKSRKEERRKSRNEDRISREGIEERPKWGANRPPTRYLKQSEKDPLYQKRKLRQKMRETKVYDDKNSSDESQTESTRDYRKRVYGEKRHTRALWRKNDHFFARNIKMYQTEIIPLESDKTQIYYTSRCDQECCCHCRCSRRKYPEDKIDILKIEHMHSPRENPQYKSEIIDAIPLPDFNQNVRQDNEEPIAEKLSSLQDEIPTRDTWDSSPRTPSLSATTRYN